MNASPNIQDLMIKGLENWFKCQEDIEEIDKLNGVLIAQNRIGWQQLFSRRMAKEWQEEKDNYLQRTGRSNDKKSGMALTMKTIKIIWDWFHELCNERNEEQHRRDESARAIKKR